MSNQEQQKMSTMSKVLYGTGDLASSFIWSFLGSYLSVFYTDIVGITPAVVSAIFLFSRIWDGINDPMFGAIAERTKSKHGRFRPYLLYGSPLLALSGVICFTAPFTGPGPGKIIFAAITYNIVGMLYTAVNLSYGALSGVMTFDPRERTELFSWRMMGTNFGGVFLSLITMPMLLFFSGTNDGKTLSAKGYTITIAVFGVAAVALFMLLFINSKEVVKPSAEARKITVKESIKSVVTNKPLMCVFFLLLFLMTGLFGRIGLMIYYLMYVVKRFDLIPVFMMLPTFCTVISIFITKSFADKVGKKKMIVIGYTGAALCLIGAYFIDAANIPLLLVLFAGYGLFMYTTPLGMSFIPEAIDYGQDKDGVRSDGIAYAATSLATKFANAIGASLGLIIMGAFGYVANAEQTAQSITGIKLVVNIMPAAFILLAIIPTLIYPLAPEKNVEIRARLQEKIQTAK
jgi:GPH family glycoside/pentoside/hexuronide:cation symporter/probable glucitol transport protein GutA